MKHEWLAGELRKIAHGCDVVGIRGSQHINHAADLLEGTVDQKMETEMELVLEPGTLVTIEQRSATAVMVFSYPRGSQLEIELTQPQLRMLRLEATLALHAAHNHGMRGVQEGSDM